MENTEVILSQHSNRFDTRKVLNRAADITVSARFLDELETDGLTSESLDSFKLPVFKYQTQLTLHGKFPERELKRIGGYKSAFLNQNGSLGIRYNAIDYGKKERLGQYLTPYNWSYSRDSKGDSYYFRARNEESARALFKSIDVSNFYASKQLAVARLLGIYYVIVHVQAIYSKEFWPLFTAITGKTEAEDKPVHEAYVTEQQEKRRDRDQKYADMLSRQQQSKAEGENRLMTELVPQLSAYPEWTGLFMDELILVGANLDYSDRPVFVIFQLAKKGGWFQFIGDNAKALTDKPYVNAFKDHRHSFKTEFDLVRAIKVKSRVPFRILSGSSVAAVPVFRKLSAPGIDIRHNRKLGGIEVDFRKEPSDQIKQELRAMAYKYSKKGHWYNTYSPEKWRLINDLFSPAETKPVVPISPVDSDTARAKAKAKAKLNLLLLEF